MDQKMPTNGHSSRPSTLNSAKKCTININKERSTLIKASLLVGIKKVIMAN